jgi:protein-disulfide reductase (glutathione)
MAPAVLVPLAGGCGRRISEEPEGEQTPGASSASPAPTVRPASATPGGAWNAAQIEWQPYEAGLRLAKTQKKPVCLVFSTTWCPHCKNYSHVFEDPRIVAHARDFVMIHLDADAEESVASRYALDGTYIPRTYFLSSDGAIDDSIHAPRDRSRYFYDERDPTSLLAGMETAHRKLVN